MHAKRLRMLHGFVLWFFLAWWHRSADGLAPSPPPYASESSPASAKPKEHHQTSSAPQLPGVGDAEDDDFMDPQQIAADGDQEEGIVGAAQAAEEEEAEETETWEEGGGAVDTATARHSPQEPHRHGPGNVSQSGDDVHNAVESATGEVLEEPRQRSDAMQIEVGKDGSSHVQGAAPLHAWKMAEDHSQRAQIQAMQQASLVRREEATSQDRNVDNAEMRKPGRWHSVTATTLMPWMDPPRPVDDTTGHENESGEWHVWRKLLARRKAVGDDEIAAELEQSEMRFKGAKWVMLGVSLTILLCLSAKKDKSLKELRGHEAGAEEDRWRSARRVLEEAEAEAMQSAQAEQRGPAKSVGHAETSAQH